MAETTVIYDIEVFKQMNLAGFMTEDGLAYVIVNADNLPKQKLFYDNIPVYINDPHKTAIEATLKQGVVGFNNHAYDDYLIEDIINQRRPEYIKLKSDTIVNSHTLPRQKFDWWSFDLKEALQDGFSLKKWEAMSGQSVLETSIPFDYDGQFTEEMILEVVKYNVQDLRAQLALYNERKTYFEGKRLLVKEYGWDGSQRFTNTTISASYLMGRDKLSEFKPRTPVIDGIPDEAKKFLINALTASPKVSHGKTKADREKLKKEEWSELVTANHGLIYTWGWGGLHGAIGEITQTKTGRQRLKYTAVDFTNVQQWDVSSMFPNIIIRDRLLADKTDKYQQLVTERLKNKANHLPIADAQKIVINSVYGALRLQTSRLYNPNSAIAVNVSGMVAIYNLADKLADYGQIIQVNTDGITFKPNKGVEKALDELREKWEQIFDLELEVTDYDRFIQRDVNNYIAIHGNSYKTKGGTIGQAVKLNKLARTKPTIVDRAVFEYLVNQTAPLETVQKGRLSDFVFTLTSMMGKTQTGLTVDENGVKLDNRVNRVYASTNGVTLFKEKTNGTLQKFSDAPEKMTIVNEPLSDETPDNIDYEFYADLANKKIKDWFK